MIADKIEVSTPFSQMLRGAMPRPELERRWALLRTLLEERGIDAAVTQGANTHSGVGGYYRWITGGSIPGSYPRSVVFTAGAMTLVSHGSFAGEFKVDPSGNEYPGVERRLTTPMLPMIAYTADYDADLVLADLRRRGARRVGLVGPAAFTHGFGACLAAAGDIEWIDITDEVDHFKAIKSPVEIGLMRAAAAMQDRLIEATENLLRPGLREYELAAELNHMSALEGSLGGFILTASGRMDQDGPPMFPRTSEMQGRKLSRGDIVLVLIENAGPGGYVTHMGRMFVLGEAPAPILAAHDQVIKEQDQLAAELLPGTAPAGLFADYNRRMREGSFGEETRLHAHAQGYDIVERPLIRTDETMKIEANMNIGIHPMIMTRKVLVTAIDNWLTGTMGAERLHHAPRKVIEVE